MTDTLTHRGPDDFGYAFAGTEVSLDWKDDLPTPFRSPGVAMGHRRLSILDLSPAGRQPFISKNRQYWLVFNGEIYNYRELRQELGNRGHSFNTQTDTEVLLAAFQEWGPDCVQRFNGMWAFVVWDQRSKKLFAARDRVGIKPLFFTRINGIWVFASEAKAIAAHPDFQPRPALESVFRFLWTGQRPEGGSTFFEGIEIVPAGHFLEFSGDDLTATRYWSLPDARVCSGMSDQEAENRFIELLEDSTRLRLRSDVKVGTMLSGGLDSTSISTVIRALLAQDHPDASSIDGQQTAISASYPEFWNDETRLIRTIARDLDISLDFVFPANADVLSRFFPVVRAVEEPYWGSMPHVQDLLMRRARDLGVRVTLNGHGPDEMLAGYPARHCSIRAADALLGGRLREWRQEMTGMRVRHNVRLSEFLYSVLFLTAPGIGSWVREKYREDKRRYFRSGVFSSFSFEPTRGLDRRMEGHSGLDRRLRREFTSEIVPPTLLYEDRISMAASVESRVPFLDHRMVEFCFSIDDRQKIRSGVTKSLIRRAMEKRIPAAILQQNLKVYFNGPVNHWVRGPLKPLVQELIFDGDLRTAGILDPIHLRKLFQRLWSEEPIDSWETDFMWRAFTTEAWMKVFF